MADTPRCAWAMTKENEIRYHDTEWGVPCFDDRTLFEFIILESAQAGLSWSTILNKRDGYRRCFAGFDPSRVACFGEEDVLRLLGDASIVRNRKKIESAVRNAGAFLDLAAKHGSFCAWYWGFVDGKPIRNAWKTREEVPAVTPLAKTIAGEMKKAGFSFLGPTVMYAYMQATGMVNDHLAGCFRHAEINAIRA